MRTRQGSRRSGDRGPVAGEAPIDLSHLRLYIGGNEELGREVLALFHQVARESVARMGEAYTARARREAAHALKGSALAVGAWQVAALASAAEAAADDPVAVRRYTAELSRAIERTSSFAERAF